VIATKNPSFFTIKEDVGDLRKHAILDQFYQNLIINYAILALKPLSKLCFGVLIPVSDD
jgi:hypothetical protein